MKKIYMTPETIGVATKTESLLLTLSSGSVKPCLVLEKVDTV